jgi:predicted TPR repeat methyltransferase
MTKETFLKGAVKVVKVTDTVWRVPVVAQPDVERILKALEASGDVDKAVMEYKMELDLDPNEDCAKKNLKRLGKPRIPK